MIPPAPMTMPLLGQSRRSLSRVVSVVITSPQLTVGGERFVATDDEDEHERSRSQNESRGSIHRSTLCGHRPSRVALRWNPESRLLQRRRAATSQPDSTGVAR